MQDDLINQLVELTGASEEDVQSYLDQQDMDKTYNIIDAARRGKVDELKSMVSDLQPSENKVDEASMKDKDKNKIKIDMPKPRDPMARELQKGQYQPKRTPTKRELLNKTDRKHKGSKHYESSELAESISVSGIPSIKKMLTLAGRPFDDDNVDNIVKEFMNREMQNWDQPDMTIDDITIPVGTTLKPGLVNGLNSDFPDSDLDFDMEVDALMPEVSDAQQTPMSAIMAAVDEIKANLANIKLGEYQEAKQLINELNSVIDQLANTVKGN